MNETKTDYIKRYLSRKYSKYNLVATAINNPKMSIAVLNETDKIKYLKLDVPEKQILLNNKKWNGIKRGEIKFDELNNLKGELNK